MDTRALKKQMGAAIAMVLVAAVALGSATFAWFVSNNTVKAETTTISAQSNAPFLKIGETEITKDSGTSIKFNADKATKLYPAQVVNGAAGLSITDATKPLFQSAYASSKSVATMLPNSRYDVGGPQAAVDGEFAIEKSFKIGTADAKAGSFKDLKVSKVELTGDSADEGLKGAISVLLVCGNNWGVYKVSEHGELVGTYSDAVTTVSGHGDGVLASEIKAGSSVGVEAYVFYDGSAEKVYTDNLDNLLAGVGVKISFTATPVNTQGTDMPNAGNEVAK